jgi:lipoyl(octanoyl) transferase
MTRRLRLIDSGALPPALNMGVDEALLLSRGPAALRLYAWSPPALSLGYFQRHEEVDHAALARLGFGLVRRPTGGGAIAHFGEITFALTCDLGEPPYDGPIASSYEQLHGALATGLARLGVKARPRAQQTLASDANGGGFYCFYKSAAVDLVASGRKLIGSAQRRHAGRVLHHGSLPLIENPLTPAAGSLGELAGRSVSFEEARAALIVGLETSLRVELEPDDLTVAEQKLARDLAAEKYSSDAFLRRR